MRRLALALAVLALPAAGAVEAYVVLLDWQEGYSAVGTTPLLLTPLAARFPFDVDACHRTLLLDLLYDPAEGGASVDGVGEAAILYDFLVEAWRGDDLVSRQRIRTPGYGNALGLTDAAGAHELRVSLANGANVAWEARVRGRSIPDELACLPRVVVNEVEANPAGADAGHEWVELYNADASESVDLSLWTLSSTRGVTEQLVLPSGTVLAPGARALVTFTEGQFLDNDNESVVLTDAFGMIRDATPVASDLENDQRTWQRTTDGANAWHFAPATPP